MGVLLAPATTNNIVDSIINPISNDILIHYLGNSVFNDLNSKSENGIRGFAFTKNMEYIYNRIKLGDEVLFSESGTGLFNYYGIIIDKIHNLELGKHIWTNQGKYDWEYIYFVSNITDIVLNKKEFIYEYVSKNNYNLSSAYYLDDNKLLFSLANYLDIETLENESKSSNYYSSNKLSNSFRRVGHGKFEKDVKDNFNYKCALCEIKESTFLVASHITSWADDVHNRLNPSNGICLCVFHDKAFDKGYIGFDDNFKVVLHNKINQTGELFSLLKRIEGLEISKTKNHKISRDLLKKHREKFKLGEYANL